MGLQATGSLATTLVITKGLPCGNLPDGEAICSFGAGITPWFSLYCRKFEIPRPKQGGMGGSRVLLPGEIHQLYQTLPPEQQYYVIPRDQEARYFLRYKNITLKLNIGDKKVEKVFQVPENKAKAIITVATVINVTKERISAAIDNIKRVTSKSIVTVKNVVLRRPKR